MKKHNYFLFAGLLIVVSFFNNGAFAQLSVRQERNLTAFARLYGYVRYFYPGDEARQIDWERFAIYGSGKVLDQQSDDALIGELKQLYLPVAPTIKITTGARPATLDVRQITPPHPKLFKVISWQHHGYGVSGFSPAYKSIRLNRWDDEVLRQGKDDFYPLQQAIDVSSLAGKDFLFTAKIKVTSKLANVQIKLMKDSFVYDRLLLRPASVQQVTNSEAKTYSFTGKINPGDKKIVLGIAIDKEFKVSIDSLHFYITENGKQTEISLPKAIIQGALAPREDQTRYAVMIDDTLADKPLFNARTKIGESIQSDLVPGINCTVPLALYGDDRATYPKEDPANLHELQKQVTAVVVDYSAPRDIRLADVIISWNVFQHFFTYWDDAARPPLQILHNALTKAFTDTSFTDLFYTLKLLCADLNDGHMFYNGIDYQASAPVIFTKAEGRIVVKFVLDKKLQENLYPGDVVDSIEHQEAVAYLKEREKYLSGSDQVKEYDALMFLVNGKVKTSLNLVADHNGIKNKLSIQRTERAVAYREGNYTLKPATNGELKKGLFYYNLSADSVSKKIEGDINQLVNAKAIILDMRGYPRSDIMPIIEHLLIKKENAKWMHIPQIIYPDHKKMEYDNSGWHLPAINPHLTAKIYLLTDASAMSASESYSGYFKDLKLAMVIGQPTAGTNGNLALFKLPGNNDMYFSGMLVTNHDGSKHHLKGIVPDIIVNPTINGIKQGRDEILEQAIAEADKL